jgi:pyruvate dehydrogenase E1 component beta subunit
MFGGKARTPMVLRATYGAGTGSASQHSQALHPLFAHIPGLKLAVPSNPYDAKGLLIQAIRDDDPVVFLEHKVLYDMQGEVPDRAYAVPFGEAAVPREGEDCTIVAFGRMVGFALDAAKRLAADGVECTVVDPRTPSPLDKDTILEMVEETGRLVVVDESYPRCSLAADVAALVAEEAFGALKAPILKVTPPHAPVPYAPELERAFIPSVERIEAAVRKVVEHRA